MRPGAVFPELGWGFNLWKVAAEAQKRKVTSIEEGKMQGTLSGQAGLEGGAFWWPPGSGRLGPLTMTATNSQISTCVFKFSSTFFDSFHSFFAGGFFVCVYMGVICTDSNGSSLPSDLH